MLRPELIRIFEQAAWVVGGELRVHPGFGDTREIPALLATIERVPVEATIERAGVTQHFRTVVRSPAHGALGLSLAVQPGAGAYKQTGDRSFDAAYLVRSNDAQYSRLWLDEHVRRRLRDAKTFYSPKPFGFEVENELAYGRRRGFEDDPEVLVRAMNAVAALAARGKRLLDDWKQIADRLGGQVVANGTWRPDTRARIEVPAAGARVVIDSIHGATVANDARRCLITRVSCLRQVAAADLFVMTDRRDDNAIRPQLPRTDHVLTARELAVSSTYRIACEQPKRMLDRLKPKLARALLELRPAAVLANLDQVSVLLPGFQRDPDRLEDAIGLARSLAVEAEPAGMSGPYR